ncbi:MAG TPA: TonB-dependent siderophore receptor [Pyrinomonadaceae bacterium]|nr:TonB-dependent siderophore receptor [Pyrinomonadaceae bacterium]
MKVNAKQDRKRRRGGARRRGPRYWVVTVGAMGALVAYTVGHSRAVALAYVRDAGGVATAARQQAQAPAPTRFDIAPGPLDVVLKAFEEVTGLRVTASLDAMRGVPSPGVSGLYTPEQALGQLLDGTNITYRFTAPRAVTLEVGGLAESVEVTERASPLSSPKYTEPLLDTPQTITVITREVIEEQGATTLRDVLRNVPGLTITAGEGGVPAGDNLTLRGFSARNDVFVDGVRDLGPQSRDPFNLEQVEVVKGPGSVYTGRGSTGGSINLVSKVPSLRPAYGFTLDFGTDETRRATADLNFPLARLGLGDHAALRLNLLAHDAGVAGRDVVENGRWGVAPSVSFGLGGPTRLVLSYFHLQQDNISDYGIPWVPAANNALAAFRDRPAPVPRNTFYGFRDRDHERLRSDLATVRFEHDFGDRLSLRDQFRYGRSTRDSFATPPRFANNNSTAINRELRSWLTEDVVWDNQSDVRVDFSTGGVAHDLVAGLTLTRESNVRRTRTAPNSPTTLLDPDPDDLYTGVITTSPIVGDITANSQGLYVFDTARLGRRWELQGGLRWDRFDAAGVTTAGSPVARVDRMLSFRAGAVFKPADEGSIYASYGTSLNPSLEGLSYNTANTAIAPEKTYTFEAGAKWELLRGRLLLTGAGFRVEKTNARTPGLLPTDPVQVLEGRQRVDGAELSASGSFARGWQIFSAYTFLDSETVESNAAPGGVSEVGKELVNTPRHSFNLWTTYELPRRLTLGGGLRFVGRRYGNTINTRFVDGFWTADLMASYPLSEHVDLRFNLYNLTDAYYFDRLGGGHVVPGPGRSATLGAGFKF